MISKRSLKRFLEIYKQEFGEELSEDQLIEKANRILALYQAIYGSPFEKEQAEKNKNEKG